MITIPARTIQAVVQEFGQTGRQWVDSQPERLSALAERWQLTFGEPFEVGLPINIVFRVTRDDKPCVLKTGYPHPEMFTEMAVLDRWRDRPDCVQLIDSDKEVGCILMDQIVPGTSFRLASRGQAEHDATLRVRHLFEQIPLPPGAGSEFPGYQQWCSAAFSLYRKNHQQDRFTSHLDRADVVLADIISHHEPGWLLHGDLHHENILLREDGKCVVVDPKGVTGPKVLEYGRYIHNFLADRTDVDQTIPVSSETIVLERVKALGGEFPQDVLLRVGFIDLVLSCCWSLNSGEKLKTEVVDLIELMAALAG